MSLETNNNGLRTAGGGERSLGAEAPASSAVPSASGEADRVEDVLLFDGVCGLCNRSVDFVLSRDRRNAIRFAPLQGETAGRVRSREQGLGSGEWGAVSNSWNTVVWVDEVGRCFVRSAAIVRVLWKIGGMWWLIGWLLWLIPRPLRDIGYRIVAANRYRLFGRKETCRIPTPSERTRFLP